MTTISAFFQKILALLLAAFSFLLPQHLLPETPLDPVGQVAVTVPAVDGTTEQFDVTIQNNTPTTISYGVDFFSIEKRTLLGWSTLQKRSDYVVIAMLLSLAPSESAAFHVNLAMCYGKSLDPGVYRFNFSYYTGVGSTRAVASAEFQVKN